MSRRARLTPVELDGHIFEALNFDHAAVAGLITAEMSSGVGLESVVIGRPPTV